MAKIQSAAATPLIVLSFLMASCGSSGDNQDSASGGGAGAAQAGAAQAGAAQAGAAGAAGATQAGGMSGDGAMGGNGQSLGGSGGASGGPSRRLARVYDIVEVKGPSGSSESKAINDDGLVVGQYHSGTTSVVYTWTTQGGLVSESPNDGYVVATALNNQGVYCAYDGDAVGKRFGSSNISGSYAPLPVPPDYMFFQPSAINDSNVIVGGTILMTPRGFALSNGSYTLLDLLPSGTQSSAGGINNSGVIVGSAKDANSNVVAVRFDGATPTPLGTLGGDDSYANAINDAGSIVGYAQTANGDEHAFYYVDDTMTDLGVLAGEKSHATAINEDEIVVGYSSTTTSDVSAFGWTQSDGLVELATRLGEATGWTLIVASDINKSGQIVGSGTHDGAAVGFVMTPRP